MHVQSPIAYPFDFKFPSCFHKEVAEHDSHEVDWTARPRHKIHQIKPVTFHCIAVTDVQKQDNSIKLHHITSPKTKYRFIRRNSIIADLCSLVQ